LPRVATRQRSKSDDSGYLPGHLPGVATPVGTCAAKGLLRRQSTKKPI